MNFPALSTICIILTTLMFSACDNTEQSSNVYRPELQFVTAEDPINPGVIIAIGKYPGQENNHLYNTKVAVEFENALPLGTPVKLTKVPCIDCYTRIWFGTKYERGSDWSFDMIDYKIIAQPFFGDI